MRNPLILVLLAAGAASQAQTFDYNVFIKGKPSGTVRTSFLSQKTGYVENSVGTLKQGGQALKLSTITELDASYNWRRKRMEMSANGRTAIAVAVPKGNGAHVTITAGGKTVERDIPKATKTTTIDASAAWFRSYTPKVGTAIKHQRFDLQKMAWADVVYRYVGPKQAKVGGTTRSGFGIEREEDGKKTMLIVDNKGIPILYDSTDMRMERSYK
jgi:hypothetical protein